MSFKFFDMPDMIDNDLQLIRPSARWVDEVVYSCHHPLGDQDSAASVTRQSLIDFINVFPEGHEPGHPNTDRVPAYHFWMYLLPQYNPPVQIAGGLSLRIGWTPDIVNYLGHVGYGVYPPARGQHLAERACRLLLPLARKHELPCLWITCNPDNIPSRRTCERLGAKLIDIVNLPQTHYLYTRGERQKCRYRMEL